VLVECEGNDRELDTQRFNAAMESAFDAGLIVDAAIGQSDSDAEAFWALRDDVEQVGHGGIPVVFDISLPIGAMARFTESLRDALPGIVGGDHRLFIFGHLGDGNLHIIVQVAPSVYAAVRSKIEALVYRGIEPFGGSVSAEHGIGIEKKAWLSVSRKAPELALMRTIKAALDPRGILNPGKILDMAS
jgi:FAD/FMN-containing dehydrogenase